MRTHHAPVEAIARAFDMTTEERVKSLRGKVAKETRAINALKRSVVHYSAPDYTPNFYNSSTGPQMVAWCEREIIRHEAQRAHINGLIAELKKAVAK